MAVNKQYKDSVFTLLFNDKEKLIELYNAVEGTNYGLETDVQINTLDNVLFMNPKNDLSFLIDGKFVVLVEQASLNENLPMRFLLYIARVYKKMVDNKAIYKEKLIKVPTPEFIVLYNGKADFVKEEELKLSDAFMELRFALELKVKTYNINYGKSSDILEKSRTLKDYSYFVFSVNQYREKGLPLEEAIQSAIKDCINQNVLKDFLESHGSEVIKMLTTEFNMEDALEVRKEEGLEEGKRKAAGQIAIRLLDVLDDNTIAEKTGLTIEEVRGLRSQNG